VDALDRKALPLLMKDGRITWSELGQALGLSAPAAAERVRKLEEHGVIKQFAALLDAEALGYSLTAFVFVTLGDQRKRAAFQSGVGRLEQIVECHHVAGDDDFLLKVQMTSMAQYDAFVRRALDEEAGVLSFKSLITISTVVEDDLSTRPLLAD